MAWMIYQRYTTAVIEAYGGRPVGDQLEAARAHRRWLEGLEIDAGLRSSLVEQAKAIEEGFARIGG